MTMPDALSRLRSTLCLALLMCVWVPVWAQADLRFAVLAFRSKEKTQAQWAPMAQYLQNALGRSVTVHVYDFSEINVAIARNEVDILLTNPGNYTLLRHRNGVSAPLGTLITKEGGNSLTAFGGVMVVRADNTTVQSLADLRGKRIAVTQVDSFGGYQAQVFEMLEAGLPAPPRSHLQVVGMPHDAVVRSVLSDRSADCGGQAGP
jgi:ABC-type phosphate/phosphonate transport system substrate-binding protein